MANPMRGEVAIRIDGQTRRMRLTLGALAELEAALAVKSLVSLAEKFEAGQVSTAELIALLAAGLRGAGEPVSIEDLSGAQIEGGALGAMRAGLELLAQTFQGAA